MERWSSSSEGQSSSWMFSIGVGGWRNGGGGGWEWLFSNGSCRGTFRFSKHKISLFFYKSIFPRYISHKMTPGSGQMAGCRLRELQELWQCWEDDLQYSVAMVETTAARNTTSLQRVLISILETGGHCTPGTWLKVASLWQLYQCHQLCSLDVHDVVRKLCHQT